MFRRRTTHGLADETGHGHEPNGALFALGRAILGGYFLYNGINHFKALDQYASYAESKGVPMPKAAVAATGGLLVGGGVSLLTGIKPKLGAGMIETFLLGVTPQMHAFWAVDDSERQAEQINFMKNMALVGAALVTSSIPEPWPASLSRKNGDAHAAS
jgi:putative oxidoreductase